MSGYRKVIITIRNKFNDSPETKEKYVNLPWLRDRLQKLKTDIHSNGPTLLLIDKLISEINERKSE